MKADLRNFSTESYNMQEKFGKSFPNGNVRSDTVIVYMGISLIDNIDESKGIQSSLYFRDRLNIMCMYYIWLDGATFSR